MIADVPGGMLVADLLQILVLEALVADLAPDAAGAGADGGGDDDAGREDQPNDAAGDRASLRPLLAARIGGLVDLHLAAGGVDDHGRVDQVDRAVALRLFEVLGGCAGPVLGVVRRNEEFQRARAHRVSLCLVGERASPPIGAIQPAHSHGCHRPSEGVHSADGSRRQLEGAHLLIADIRGYTSFTQARGDEAAAELATAFAELTREAIEAHNGNVIELRGDEAMAVFASARNALRAAVRLQETLADEVALRPSYPLMVGIGLDAGEAVPVEDGYRGGALNLAARLCSQAGPGEVLASQGVIHLARAVDGLRFRERGALELKGLDAPVAVHLIESVDAPVVVTGPACRRSRCRSRWSH